MDYYLIKEKEDKTFHLPVNPEEITVDGVKQIDTFRIINLGEVDFPSGDKITEIQFSSFFPVEHDDSFCQYADIPVPEEALEQLLSWRDAGEPVRLLVTQTSVNLLVLISAMSYRSVGGEPGDIYFSLTLRSWREVKVRTTAQISLLKTAGVGSAAIQTRTDTMPVPAVYTVRSGDSLWKIAKRELGLGGRWKEIYEKNKEIIGADPGLIKIGQRLVMPA